MKSIISLTETENKQLRDPKQSGVTEHVIYTNLADRSVSEVVRLQTLGEIDNVKCRHESTNITGCPVARHNQTVLTTL